MIWRLRWGERWVYVYLLLEFQSSVDRLMAVRLLTYVGLLYQDLAAAGEIPSGSPLPPVLPIVLYNGEKSWWAKTSLDDLIEPDLPEQLRRWQPQIRYLLLDEQRLADTELAGKRNVAAALFRLENSRRPEDIERVVASLIDWLAAPEQDAPCLRRLAQARAAAGARAGRRATERQQSSGDARHVGRTGEDLDRRSGNNRDWSKVFSKVSRKDCPEERQGCCAGC